MHPHYKKRFDKFRRQRRSYFSAWVLGIACFLGLFAEMICNDKPYILGYDGKWYFPMAKFYSSTEFGQDALTAPDYKTLTESVEFKSKGGWAVYPPVRFHPNESIPNLASPPPTKPTRENWLGTDDRGRDLLTRIIYGFRNSMLFALVSCVAIVVLAYAIGAIQGFLGGRVDFYGQRAIEIWSALPVLYVIIFLLSLFPSTLLLLTAVWVAFSWIGLSGYIRAEVLRLRRTDFVEAARALGASTSRILFRHILPNALTPIITFSPFIIAAGVGSLAALDYLGLGLPPPTASWGELLRQGKENLSSWWLSLFPFLSLFLTLLLLNFIGEGFRSAFDAKT